MCQTAENLTDLLFPRRCPLCQRILTQKGELICEACAKELPYIKEPKCMICSRPIRDERKMLCGICENKVHYFIRGDCTFIYEGKLRDALCLGYNPKQPFDDSVVVKGVNLERAKNSPCILNEAVLQTAVKSIR